MTPPKVSIIVPTYNRVTLLKETIVSILRQEYKDYELIISDNASTDGTEEMVKNIGDHRIIYSRNEKNLGMAANFNVALTLCRGEYIHIFSDDDVMLSGCLSERVTVLDQYPSVGLVHSDINQIDKAGNIVYEYHWSTKMWKRFEAIHKQAFFKKDVYHAYLYNTINTVCMPTAMIRKEALLKAGLIDTHLKYIIDWDFWLRITLFYDVYYINKKHVSYRIHGNNTTNDVVSLLKYELNYIKNKLQKNFPGQVHTKRTNLNDLLQEKNFYYDYNIFRAGYHIIKRSIGERDILYIFK